MTEDRYFDDCAAYALGALDADEAAEMRVHVRGCARCRAEVERLGAVSEALGRAVPALASPPELRRRVLEEIAAQARPAPPLRSERRARARWRPVAALGAALAAGVGLLVGALVVGGSSPTRSLSAAVAPARAWHAAQAPTVTLRTTGGAGVLVLHGLPPAPAGKIYEVWVERAGRPLPTDALFDATSAGTATVAVPGNLDGASAVLVTAERLGGARVPTMAPLVTASLG